MANVIDHVILSQKSHPQDTKWCPASTQVASIDRCDLSGNLLLSLTFLYYCVLYK